MQRAGDAAVLCALAGLAQIDEGDIRPSDQRDRLRRLQRPAAARDLLLRQADLHVGRHGDVHHLRVRQFQVGHQRDVVVDRLDLQARIVALLLANGGDGVAFVVVRGEHQRLVGQPQQLAEQRFILRAGVAVLEIGAAGAADQQRVAGEDAVAPSRSCRNRRCGRACRARPCSSPRW